VRKSSTIQISACRIAARGENAVLVYPLRSLAEVVEEDQAIPLLCHPVPVLANLTDPLVWLACRQSLANPYGRAQQIAHESQSTGGHRVRVGVEIDVRMRIAGPDNDFVRLDFDHHRKAMVACLGNLKDTMALVLVNRPRMLDLGKLAQGFLGLTHETTTQRGILTHIWTPDYSDNNAAGRFPGKLSEQASRSALGQSTVWAGTVGKPLQELACGPGPIGCSEGEPQSRQELVGGDVAGGAGRVPIVGAAVVPFSFAQAGVAIAEVEHRVAAPGSLRGGFGRVRRDRQSKYAKNTRAMGYFGRWL